MSGLWRNQDGTRELPEPKRLAPPVDELGVDVDELGVDFNPDPDPLDEPF